MAPRERRTRLHAIDCLCSRCSPEPIGRQRARVRARLLLAAMMLGAALGTFAASTVQPLAWETLR